MFTPRKYAHDLKYHLLARGRYKASLEGAIQDEIAQLLSYCVKEGGSGDQSGRNWVNAMPDLPERDAGGLRRGSTYYIAGGSYGSHLFNDSEEGTKYITIKKATVGAHGSGVGWDDSYATNQAVFNSPVGFNTGYYIWDGKTRNEFDWSDESAYGFSVIPSGGPLDRNYLMGAPYYGYPSFSPSHIYVYYTHLRNLGDHGVTTAVQSAFYANRISGDRLIPYGEIAKCWIGCNSSNLLVRGFSNWNIYDNYFYANWSHSTGQHGTQISTGMCEDVNVFRNIFKDTMIYIFGHHRNDSDPDDLGNFRFHIYNNLVIGGLDLNSVWGVSDSDVVDVANYFKIHHNTHVNVPSGGHGLVFIGQHSGPGREVLVYNNLCYNCDNADFSNGIYDPSEIVHDYNAFYDCTGNMSAEANREDGVGNPFVGGGDYHLAAQTQQGKVLIAPFNVDFDSVARAHFDKGVYEYV